jgi:hypothetical protein
VTIPVRHERYLQIPGGSTGWSIAAYTSGIAQVEVWRK